MTTDEAMTIAVRFMETGITVAAPLLGIAVVIGVGMGVLQTATQIQEPSIAYAAKVAGIVALTLFAGPAIAEKLLAYTRASLEAIAHVTE